MSPLLKRSVIGPLRSTLPVRSPVVFSLNISRDEPDLAGVIENEMPAAEYTYDLPFSVSDGIENEKPPTSSVADFVRSTAPEPVSKMPLAVSVDFAAVLPLTLATTDLGRKNVSTGVGPGGTTGP